MVGGVTQRQRRNTSEYLYTLKTILILIDIKRFSTEYIKIGTELNMFSTICLDFRTLVVSLHKK